MKNVNQSVKINQNVKVDRNNILKFVNTLYCYVWQFGQISMKSTNSIKISFPV